MDLYKNSWYVRLFFWSLQIWGTFWKEYTSPLYEDRTNLCHFMKVICVLMPIALGFNLLLLVSAIFVATILPIWLFGWIGYAWILGTIFFLMFLKKMYFIYHDRHLQRIRESQKPSQPIVLKATKTAPSGGELVVMWFVAKKQKVCPEIRFIENKEVENV